MNGLSHIAARGLRVWRLTFGVFLFAALLHENAFARDSDIAEM
jgi:hypothetical protein